MTRSSLWSLIMASILTTLLTACASRAPSPPVGLSIDWTKYQGVWYEAARLDHSFERGLEAVTATYSPLPDGRIRVINAGRRGSPEGEPTSAQATARVTGPATLSVTFFWPFSGDYRILAIEPSYRWAVVGSSTMSYLWFLHRSPQMDVVDWVAMEDAARKLGYDLSGLIRVKQPMQSDR